MKNRKEFKEENQENIIDWDNYKMKKNYGLFFIIIGFLVYMFIAFFLIYPYINLNFLNNLFSIISFTLGIIAFIFVIYYAMRIVRYLK